jgi:hypothetical protein
MMSPAVITLLFAVNPLLMSSAQMDGVLTGLERSTPKAPIASLGRIEQATGLTPAPGPPMAASGVDGVLSTEGVDPATVPGQKTSHNVRFEGMRFKPARLVAAPGSQIVLVNMSPVVLVFGKEGKGPKLKPLNPGEKTLFTVGATDPSTKDIAGGFTLFAIDWRRARLEIVVAPPGRQFVLLPQGEEHRVSFPELTEGVSRLSLLIDGSWRRSDEFILRQNSKLILTLEMKGERLDIVTKTTVADASAADALLLPKRRIRRRRAGKPAKKRKRRKRRRRRPRK